MEIDRDKLKHISNQALLEELTGRIQKGIISLDETTSPILKVMKNSTLLKELEKRIKVKEIRPINMIWILLN
jgi:hypothetical protein